MRAIDEFVRINKIEGNIFMSFDLDEIKNCDGIACGALKAECPEFILPVLFDNSTTVATMRYSVPEHYMDIESYTQEFEIEEILKIYDKLLLILDECNDWFLLPSGFCFEEKHVYVDMQNHELKLMYIPDTSERFNEQDIKHLLISLLEKCNETSGGTIQLQLYKYFYKPKFSIAEFRIMLDNYMASLNVKDRTVTKEKVPSDKMSAKESEAKASIPAPVEKQEEKVKKQPEPPVVEEASPVEQEKAEEVSPRTYYAPKASRSQLSQEEIEEMVKSIYSGKTPEDVSKNNASNNPTIGEGTQVADEEDTIYGPSRNGANNKKKNLFDNVFPGGKPQTSPTKSPSGNGHNAVLKSISTHARYDLPKQIDIILYDESFVIGRATRTGEATGANFEFSAEITPISRIHAKIERKEGAYYIQDLGSSNGTFVNGTKLEPNKPCMIEDGDKIAFAIAYSKNSIEYAFAE